MPRRVRLCEKRQRKARPQVGPQPPIHGCATPDEYAWEQYAKRHQRTYGHPPSRSQHASKLVMDAEHADTITPPVGAPPQWAGKVPFDPYRTEGE